jgi:hypothetical protein
MRIRPALALWLLLAMPAWANDDADAYQRAANPEWRSGMRSAHVLGEIGQGSVNGTTVYGGHLAGWSDWAHAYLLAADLGGVWLAPALLSGQHGNFLAPLFEGRAGYNLVGPHGDGLSLEPLWQLDERTVITLGVGGGVGVASTTDGLSAIGLTAGPLIGARFRILPQHNLTAYGHYVYGLNRAADTYEGGLHASFGTSVVEAGYRGGQLAAYSQGTSSGTRTLNPPTPVGYGAAFVRFSVGY